MRCKSKTRSKKSRYKFVKWLINKAIAHDKVYWLLWGILAILGVCAWRFGLAWIS